MARNIKDIELDVQRLGENPPPGKELLFELLVAYGRSPSNVNRLRSIGPNSLNLSSAPEKEVLQKGIVLFQEHEQASEGELLESIERLSISESALSYGVRFVLVSDGAKLMSKDQKTSETRVIALDQLGENFSFFLPWAGMEKATFASEAHADIRASEKMAKLFDELISVNKHEVATNVGRHGLNIFFSRLLFCLFAEDTGIFDENQFTKAVIELTRESGEDMSDFLSDLFQALDSRDEESKPTHLRHFPYVNGRLFSARAETFIPAFNSKARSLLIECGRLKWSEINPDIFGSMFQAVVNPDQRLELGQHYTSVPNILKTIEPLFLDDLKLSFERNIDNAKGLEALLKRIGQIKIFDPACGSGNFLIIAYKELRKLEHAILEQLGVLRGNHNALFGSSISIENFFGIEIDDFAAEVAILSLWIAKHQMNLEFWEKFGTDVPLIPLKEMGHIRHGNATRIDWKSVCPNDGSEIYLIGNPPYKGGKSQKADMKSDYPFVFGTRPYSKDLDYIALWFIKGAEYIQASKAQLAFVSTNSVVQGDHVALLFPTLISYGLEIGYAYTSFKWENNAKHNAGVSVVVINLRNTSNAPKYLYVDGLKVAVRNINGYLADGPNVSVGRRNDPISALPKMTLGSMPKDGGGLLLEPHERLELLASFPEAGPLVKRYMGALEFINDKERYCLWIPDELRIFADSIPPIARRLETVKQFRLASDAQSTVDFADKPHRFKQIAFKSTDSIIVPRVSSERRDYIPIGYLNKDTVISDAANAVYDAEPWVFALLVSRMHMVWTRAVGGKLETRYRYSNTIVYNNFPVPALNGNAKDALGKAARRILEVREFHSELTLGELYDPETMPENLREAHSFNDGVVDGLYRTKNFGSDEERLSHLFSRFIKSNNLQDQLDGLLFTDD